MKWVCITWGILGVLAASADSAFIDFEKGLVFPQELGGMACEKSEKYNNESLGYSLFYERDGTFSAEVSIFNLGRSSVGTGSATDGINVVLASIDSWLEREAENGAVSSVRKRGSLTTPKKGDLKFLNIVYQFFEPRVVDGLTNNVPRIASFYVTGAKDNFIKVDFRFDLVESDQARAMSEQLVRQMIGLLKANPSEEDLLMAACDAAIYNPSDHGGRTAAQHVFSKAQSMDELIVYEAFFVWPQNYSKPKNSDLLLAAYFAGAIKAVISKNAESDGGYEAFESMLKAYEAMREREDLESIPRLDEWIKAADKTALYKRLMVEFEYAAPE